MRASRMDLDDVERVLHRAALTYGRNSRERVSVTQSVLGRGRD
jgi:hypothetical protein